jgi:hypothetical protein
VATSSAPAAAAASWTRAPVAGTRDASAEPAAPASVISASSSVTCTGLRSPVVCRMNEPVDPAPSRNASGRMTTATILQGILARGVDDAPSSSSSHAGGSVIANAMVAPSAHSSVSASHPAVNPHFVTTAPPATIKSARATTCTARERASILWKSDSRLIATQVRYSSD